MPLTPVEGHGPPQPAPDGPYHLGDTVENEAPGGVPVEGLFSRPLLQEKIGLPAAEQKERMGNHFTEKEQKREDCR